MKKWLINRVRNWGKSTEKRSHRVMRGWPRGSRWGWGCRAARGGGLMAAHPTSPKEPWQTHLPDTKASFPNVYKIFHKYCCFWFPLWRGWKLSFRSRVCLGPQAQGEKEPSQDCDYRLTWGLLSHVQIPYWG